MAALDGIGTKEVSARQLQREQQVNPTMPNGNRQTAQPGTASGLPPHVHEVPMTP